MTTRTCRFLTRLVLIRHSFVFGRDYNLYFSADQGGRPHLCVPHRHCHRQRLHAQRHHPRRLPQGQPRLVGKVQKQLKFLTLAFKCKPHPVFCSGLLTGPSCLPPPPWASSIAATRTSRSLSCRDICPRTHPETVRVRPTAKLCLILLHLNHLCWCWTPINRGLLKAWC